MIACARGFPLLSDGVVHIRVKFNWRKTLKGLLAYMLYVSPQDWKGISDLFGVLFFILLIAGIFSYFYQTTYVTFLGTFYVYPYRGYVFGLGFGAAFCVIASIVAGNMANQEALAASQVPRPFTVIKRYCTACGSEVSFNDSYCPKCGKPLS